MGLSQPDVSRLLRGQFRDVSVERLMRMLTRLGCDVDIVIRGRGKATTQGITIPAHRTANRRASGSSNRRSPAMKSSTIAKQAASTVGRSAEPCARNIK